MDEKSVLSGKWQWLYTEHTHGWCEGLAFYETISPSQDGNSYAVTFTERGKLNFYKNEKREKSYRIVFQEFVKVDASRYAFQLKLNNDALKIIEGMVSEDTLNLKYPYLEADPNCENYLNFFIRE